MAEWLLSTQAEIVAVTSLLLAVINLFAAGKTLVIVIRRFFKAIRRVFRTKGTPVLDGGKESNEEGGSSQMNRRSYFMIVVGLLLIVVSGGIVASRHVLAQSLPPNARLTTDAWNAFNKGDWAAAIQKADECINQFQDQADDQQAELEKKHATVPSGTVPKQVKDEILNRGPINDVATAFWIKGQALERLGKIDDAKRAYQGASKYTFGRCFDSSWDGFWSPSERAMGRLRHL
jgi:hypothetical protein